MAFFQIITMVQVWKLCSQGKLNKVRRALARGEDVNSASGGEKKTGLMWAVALVGCGRLNSGSTVSRWAIVRLLLAQPSVDLNCVDSKGWTALQHAAYSDNAEGVRLLLDDPRLTTANHKSDSDGTPVMQAMLYECEEALRELVHHPSVDLDTTDGEGRTLEDLAR